MGYYDVAAFILGGVPGIGYAQMGRIYVCHIPIRTKIFEIQSSG